MTDIPALIARVRELDAAATKGPWTALREWPHDAEDAPPWANSLTEVWPAENTLGGASVAACEHERDVALIAEYRAAAPALATALEAAMAENERLRTELEMIRDAAADAIRDNEHVGFTVRTLHVLRAIKLEETR